MGFVHILGRAVTRLVFDRWSVFSAAAIQRSRFSPAAEGSGFSGQLRAAGDRR
jgi:hypothetical protein